jgi:tetratricopeptide (TPR) repeat protein
MGIRTPEKYGNLPLILALLFFLTGISFAQENRQEFLQRYQNGTLLFQSSHWLEASIEFRRAQENALDMEDWSRALYWVVLSELANSDYGSAIRDMDELERKAPNSGYTRDMAYHRGRVYFNQGFFEDSLILFRRYLDSIFEEDSETENRRAAAFFWIGECLYTMGQFDEALKFYEWVVERFPQSPKIEVSLYRIDLIKHKKVEAELLALLQWSHEESLRNGEDFQRQIRTYEYTINQYQRRVAELSAGQNQELISQLTDNDPLSDNWQSIYDRLLERARRLNRELEQMINEYVSAGGDL